MVDASSTTRRLARLFGLVALVLVLFAAFSPMAHERAVAKSARYINFDVTLTLRNDGSFHVVERQRVQFAGGTFMNGHRSIPTTRTTGIENIKVSEAGAGPYREVDMADLTSTIDAFSVFVTSTRASIYWTYDPIYDGEKTFVVEYDVRGALRVYQNATPPSEQIWWSAFGSDLTNETPVESASLKVTLPKAVKLQAVKIGEDGKGDPTNYSSAGKTFTWTDSDISAGDDFTARLEFPTIVDSAPPSWQAADDERRANAAIAKQHDAEISLLLLAAGLVLATGGGVGAYGVWYMRGRDPDTGLVADFLPSPTSDLPPGVAGTLLDECADERDVVATIFDLGRCGILKVTDAGLLGPAKTATRSDYIIEVVDPNRSMRPVERTVLGAIFGNSSPKVGEKTSLKEAGPRIIDRAPAIKQALYDELISRGFFTQSPESIRRRWRKVGLFVIASAVVFGVIGTIALNWKALVPAAVVLLLGIVLARMSKAMPRKTGAGAEEAAKWRAFRRYLADLDKYENISESKSIVERYLSYAIAFDLEFVWVGRFKETGGFSFDWLDVFDWNGSGPRRSTHHGWGGGYGSLDIPKVDMPDVHVPNVQSVSNSAASGIQKGSNDLGDVFNVVGALLEVVSAFSGGGGGGSSGGGGGGFS
jgi:Predicted membrane protein (DUF2207)